MSRMFYAYKPHKDATLRSRLFAGGSSGGSCAIDCGPQIARVQVPVSLAHRNACMPQQFGNGVDANTRSQRPTGRRMPGVVRVNVSHARLDRRLMKLCVR